MMPAETPARSTAVRSSARTAVDGKFFRVGDEKFYLKGITYGPFKPSRDGELFPSSDTTHADFLCTFTSFPPTEFLRAETADFLCFNVYLDHRKPFENYLARLQMIAGSKPLVLGEFGFDSIRHGEARKSEMLQWQIESAFRG